MSKRRAYVTIALAFAVLTPVSTLAQGSEAQDPAPSPSPAPANPAKEPRYQDGMIIWKTSDDASVPFLLKFNVNTQVRYLNTKDSPESFTDHLGVVREVHTAYDITVNRSMFILGGGSPSPSFSPQKARIPWIIGTQPLMPAVYGVKVPL